MTNKEILINYLKIAYAEFKIVLAGFYEGFFKHCLIPLIVTLLLSLCFKDIRSFSEHYFKVFLDVRILYFAYAFCAINISCGEMFHAPKWVSYGFKEYGNYIGIILAVMLFGVIIGFCHWQIFIEVLLEFFFVTAEICILYVYIYQVLIANINSRKKWLLKFMFVIIVLATIYLAIFHPTVIKYLGNIVFIILVIIPIACAIILFKTSASSHK